MLNSTLTGLVRYFTRNSTSYLDTGYPATVELASG
jgi:hypothetical protein